jgi:hypothetical protein
MMGRGVDAGRETADHGDSAFGKARGLFGGLGNSRLLGLRVPTTATPSASSVRRSPL